MFLKCHCLRLSRDLLKDNCLILGATRFEFFVVVVVFYTIVIKAPKALCITVI